MTNLHDKLDGAGWVAQLADVGDVSLLDGIQGSQGIFQDRHCHCQLPFTLLLDGSCQVSLHTQQPKSIKHSMYQAGWERPGKLQVNQSWPHQTKLNTVQQGLRKQCCIIQHVAAYSLVVTAQMQRQNY